MALVTVAELKSVLGVGSLYPDAELQEACSTADDVVTSYLSRNIYPVTHYARNNANVATVWTASPHGFIVGQSVTLTMVPTGWNGTKTVTDYSVYSFSFASTGSEVLTTQLVPPGSAAGPANIDYSLVPAAKEAAMAVAVDVWTNRLAPGGQPQAVDFTPSPYRIGRTLMQRVIGILAPYLDTKGLVG